MRFFCFFLNVWKCWERRASVSFICSFSTCNDTSANARFMQDCMFRLLCKVSKKWRLIFVVILLAGGESDWNFRSKHLVQSEFLFHETYSRLRARCACSSCYHGGRRGFMRHARVPLWGCVQICAWCAGRAEISVRGFYYRKLWHSAFNPPITLLYFTQQPLTSVKTNLLARSRSFLPTCPLFILLVQLTEK